MFDFLFEEQTQWACRKVLGSQGHCLYGYAGTLEEPWECDPRWFAGDSTLILGAGILDRDGSRGGSSAEWTLAIKPDEVEKAQDGLLIFACIRPQAGLHTQRFGANAAVYLNGYAVDEAIGLRDRPEGHADYFYSHQSRYQQLLENPVASCGTVYGWPIFKRQLAVGPKQTIKVVVDPQVFWEFDYVVLKLRKVERKFNRNLLYRVIIPLSIAIVGAILTWRLTTP